MKIRVVWESSVGYSVPGEPFTVDVDTVENGHKVMALLAAYDRHHHEASDAVAVDSGKADFNAGRLVFRHSNHDLWQDHQPAQQSAHAAPPGSAGIAS